ncbi:hypothetical protein HDU81_003232 [Chytriomyces hyalinus]|nr:hypothetical protein HDU81_003232 [Chytriomyces hyalinus]
MKIVTPVQERDTLDELPESVALPQGTARKEVSAELSAVQDKPVGPMADVQVITPEVDATTDASTANMKDSAMNFLTAEREGHALQRLPGLIASPKDSTKQNNLAVSSVGLATELKMHNLKNCHISCVAGANPNSTIFRNDLTQDSKTTFIPGQSTIGVLKAASSLDSSSHEEDVGSGTDLKLNSPLCEHHKPEERTEAIINTQYSTQRKKTTSATSTASLKRNKAKLKTNERERDASQEKPVSVVYPQHLTNQGTAAVLSVGSAADLKTHSAKIVTCNRHVSDELSKHSTARDSTQQQYKTEDKEGKQKIKAAAKKGRA